MNTEEISRLIRTTSDSLRSNWEIRNLQGRSLEGLANAHKQSMETIRTLKRKQVIGGYSQLVVTLLVVFGVTWLMSWLDGSWTFQIRLLWGSLFAILVVSLYMWQHSRIERSIAAQIGFVAQYDVIFEKFARSVESLNPLDIGNRYHDVVNEEVIAKRSIDLAEKVVDAEARFDACRSNPSMGRHDVAHIASWLGKCESWFGELWHAATVDFGLELDKPRIFKIAASRLSKRDKDQVKT